MTKINKVCHVVLNVRDVEASRDFYAKALGMEVVADRPERRMVFLSFGEQHHDIALFGSPSDAERGTLGLNHIAFQMQGGVMELKEMHDRLVSDGFEVHTLVDRGITKSIHLTDPDGNLLEILVEAMSGAEGKEYLRQDRPGNMPLTLDSALVG